jgi:DNA repair protein RecO (recombination protein O)
MAREEKEQIIILKTYPVGENHRGVRLLTPGNGVVSALVYGGNGKNAHKKGAVVPFCYGWGELVHDRSRGRYQLREFSLEASFGPIREDLAMTYTASLWAEVIMGSYGGGQQGPELFLLILEALYALSEAGSEEHINKVNVRFLWLFLGLSGVRPDTEHCRRCGRSLTGELHRDGRGRLFCSSCASADLGVLPAGIVPYLKRADTADWEEFLRIGVAGRTMEQLKRWLYAVLQDHMNYPLKTLKSGSFLL